MTYQTYNFPNHIKGDTFNGVEFTLEVNSVAVDLTNASILMYLKKQKAPCDVVASFSTDTTKITITDAVNGVFQFNNQIIDVPAATYDYDIQITLNNGNVKTYIKGTWTILQDITNG
jgi:hypothetical protein